MRERRTEHSSSSTSDSSVSTTTVTMRAEAAVRLPHREQSPLLSR